MWAMWYAWLIAAVALAILEVIAPAFVFLGFAIGAAIVGLLILVGLPVASMGLPTALVVFAVLSLIAWIVLRRVVGVREGQKKVWDQDIND